MKNNTIKLLNCLRENSREKLTSISKKTGIPVSTLFDMIQEMKGDLITKNTVLIDFSKLAFTTKAQILIKVENKDKEALKRHLYCNENVNSLFKVNGGWNFIIETIHKNIKDLDAFIDNLNEYKVTNVEIHYLVDEIKKESFIP